PDTGKEDGHGDESDGDEEGPDGDGAGEHDSSEEEPLARNISKGQASETNEPNTEDAHDSDGENSDTKGKGKESNLSSRQRRIMRRKELVRTEEENVLLARAADWEAKVKPWFVNHRGKQNATKTRVWKDFDKVLDKKVLGNRPRPVQPWQFYMSHPDYKEKIDARYKEVYGDGHSKTYLKDCGAVARELLKEESPEVIAMVTQGVADRYESEVKEYDALKQVDWTDTDDIEVLNARREQLPALITQFLETACKLSQTSFSGVLIGENLSGQDGEDKVFTASVAVGTTPGPNPQRFDEWDPTGYKYLHVRSFAQFFLACSRMRRGLSTSPPTYTPDQLEELENGVPIPTPYVASETADPSNAGPSTAGPSNIGKKTRSSAKSRKTPEPEELTGSDTEEEEDEDYDQLDPSDSEQVAEQVPKTPPVTPKLQKNRKLGKELGEELAGHCRLRVACKTLMIPLWPNKTLAQREKELTQGQRQRQRQRQSERWRKTKKKGKGNRKEDEEEEEEEEGEGETELKEEEKGEWEEGGRRGRETVAGTGANARNNKSYSFLPARYRASRG
ncbi:hypothetical protein K435DRAFT_875815, partial [Dendrothele bispora CBS 962.96]